MIERSSFGEHRALFARIGANTFEGTWNHGITTRLTVTAFTKAQVVMQRTDTAGFGLLTGHYTGRRVGNAAASGTAKISNGFSVAWEASW